MAREQAIWRPMRTADLPALTHVANAAHPDLSEDREVFAERLALCPEGCMVLERSGEIVGYAISHPIVAGAPPRLNSLLGRIPPGAEEYYIHDLALLPEMRGSGLAREAIGILLERAKGYKSAALIAVKGTGDFWTRFGFRPSPADMRQKLAAYGDDAVYMVRTR